MSKDLNSRQQNQISWINDQWQPRWYMWPDAKMAEAEWRFTANTRTRLQAGSCQTIGMSRDHSTCTFLLNYWYVTWPQYTHDAELSVSREHSTRTFLPNYRYVTWSQYTQVLLQLSVCHVFTIHARSCQNIGMSRDITRALSDYRYVTWLQYSHVVRLGMSRDHSTRSSCQTIGMSRDDSTRTLSNDRYVTWPHWKPTLIHPLEKARLNACGLPEERRTKFLLDTATHFTGM